ncbi:MAG TPA: hypothetical protein EYQ50_19345 [Verrucomicrobiales bacterium]|nr:hypothetical protein [Verrucomicrobiales bacterium]HIL70562.1 hypothetical protein [Verrucomicrobiota bacterium]
MNYTVMQTRLEPLDLDALKRAFGSISQLTDADAGILSRHGYGILVNSLPKKDVWPLHSALANEGIQTQVVPDSDIPELPVLKHVRRLQIRDDSLGIMDSLGREIPIPWKDIMMITAGKTRVLNFRSKYRATPPPTTIGVGPLGGGGLYSYKRRLNSHTREIQEPTWILELFLRGNTMRFQIRSDRFVFQPIYPDHHSGRTTESFARLICDLSRFMPDALVNRGAYYIKKGLDTDLVYTNKGAFDEESRWLLWLAQQSE